MLLYLMSNLTTLIKQKKIFNQNTISVTTTHHIKFNQLDDDFIFTYH